MRLGQLKSRDDELQLEFQPLARRAWTLAWGALELGPLIETIPENP